MNTGLSLIDFVWASPVSNRVRKILRFIAISLGGSLFIALFAQISIPFIPVPITGQTFAVFLVGLVLGRNKGTAALLMYLFEGSIGLPVFAGGGLGVATLIGPSGGYLFGFLAAAFICGHFAERGYDRQYLKLSLIFILASVAVYVPGLIQLGIVIGWDKPILEYGLYPFILGDILKLLLITLLLPSIWKFIEKKD